MRLFPKLLLSYLVVVLAGVVVVSFLANQAAAREVHGFMFQGGMTTDASLAQELAAYYRGRGSWEGVEAVLDNGAHMGGMMGQRLIVADARGAVVADSDGVWTGRSLSSEDLAAGVMIEVDDVRVGTLVAQGGMGMMGGLGFGPGGSDAEGLLLARMNRAIWVAALAAGGVAILVGGLFAFGLVQPIRRLTQATREVARGNLSQRVPVNSGDEIGELAESFNSMAADLQKAESLRRDMIADVAHELRNPIAVLQGNLEAVVDGVLPPSEENLQPLLDQTRLLSRLVDDLRTLALADAGQLSLDRAPTDPATLVRSVVARFASQAEAKSITLRAEIPDSLPALSIDSQRIEQVLGNLLSNALRHTPEGGEISVQLSVISDQWLVINRPAGAKRPMTDNNLLITVADTGPGIPADALPYVFDRFYRVDKSRARADGGSGLGLAIARQLVEAHGGTIWVENEAGKGATIQFTLPVKT